MQKRARKERLKILITAQTLDSIIINSFIFYFICAPILQFFLYKQSNEFIYNTALYLLIAIVFPIFLFRTVLSEKRNIVPTAYTLLIMIAMFISFFLNLDNLQRIVSDLIVTILSLIALNTFNNMQTKNKIETAIMFSILAMAIASIFSPLSQISDVILPVTGLCFVFWKLINLEGKMMIRVIALFAIASTFILIAFAKFSLTALICLILGIILTSIIYYFENFLKSHNKNYIIAFERITIWVLLLVVIYLYPISKTLATGYFLNFINIENFLIWIPLAAIIGLFLHQSSDNLGLARFSSIIVLLLGIIVFEYPLTVTVILAILLITHVAPVNSNLEYNYINKNRFFQAGILSLIIFAILVASLLNFIRAEYYYSLALKNENKIEQIQLYEKAFKLNPFNNTYKAAVSNSSGKP